MMLVADSGGAHVSKEPDVAKMDLIAADMAVAVCNGYVWDARRHARLYPDSAPLSKLSMIAMVWVS